MTVSAEMPRYRCHKEVWALKLAAVDGKRLTPAEHPYAPFEVSDDFIAKHQPKAGGYYVQYKGGYVSFSPADAFEDGYTRV